MGYRGRQKQQTVPRDFYLGAYEVTQGQWQAVMGTNPSYFSRTGGGADTVKSFSDADLKQFPVECVSWGDVKEFLKQLNAREKNGGLLYRLPTEAEWEYACREGASSQEECAFDFYLSRPTNDLSSEQPTFNGNFPAGSAPRGKHLGRTTKVGSYQPNRLGFYDMHGNVREWCDDSSEMHPPYRMSRGGGWIDDARSCRASDRWAFNPSERFNYLGFRLAAVPSGE
jgi:formylglycine-generating enzyme required for sulfatase activity